MKSLKITLYAFFVGLTMTASFGQNNVGIGTTTPSPDAVLDIQSTGQGVLVPRMTTAQRNAIVTPTEGLLVYDIDVNCFYFYESTSAAWQNLCSSGGTGPQGPAGATGATGATGPQGPAGPAGATGPQGPAGTPGAAGAAGPIGPQGPAGPAGTNGTNGVGITSTIDNGDGTFTLNYSDGTSFTTSDLTGPAGTPGAAGAAGPQGPAGPNNVFKYTVLGNTDATVAAGAAAGPFVLMPQMTLTFTPVNASVMMFFTAAGTYTTTAFANHTIWFEVLVNGVHVREWDATTGTAYNLWDIAASTPLNVNVGVPNTVQIRWTAQRAGTVNTTINNLAASATYFNRSLMILDAP